MSMHELLRSIINYTGAELDLGFVNAIGINQSKQDVCGICTWARAFVMTKVY
jgi:hypothetical protein